MRIKPTYFIVDCPGAGGQLFGGFKFGNPDDYVGVVALFKIKETTVPLADRLKVRGFNKFVPTKNMFIKTIDIPFEPDENRIAFQERFVASDRFHETKVATS